MWRWSLSQSVLFYWTIHCRLSRTGSCYMYCAGVVSTVSLLRLIPGNATNKCRCTALYNDLDNQNALPWSYQHSKLLKCTFPSLKLHHEWGIVSGIKVSSYSVVIFFSLWTKLARSSHAPTGQNKISFSLLSLSYA